MICSRRLAKEIVAGPHTETARMENTGIRERLAADGGEPAAMTSEQFGRFNRVDAARWALVIKCPGATAD